MESAAAVEDGRQPRNDKEEEEEEEEGLGKRVLAESKKLWRVGGPAIIIRLSTFGSFVVTQSFVGRCGETELAAYALVFSLLMRFGHGIMLGMGSATETLCGQAFGAKSYEAMGIYLQRSWLVLGTVSTLLLPFYLSAGPLFELMGQPKDLAAAARPIALLFIPVQYANVFNISIQMYLQSQLKNRIIACLALPAFLLHFLLSWLTVLKLKWGVAGAMVSMSMYSWTVVAGEFIYVVCGWCPKTWTGLSRHAFSELWPVLKLSMSAGIMISLQIWYNSSLVLLAGYMKNAKIAVAAFVNVSTWELMISLGLLTATSVRVSNELGKGNAKAAKFAVKVAMINSWILGCFFLVLFLIFGKKISYAFTSSEEVAKAVSSMYILLVLSVLPNTLQTVLAGAAIGAGYRSVVAYVNIASYYVIGIPLGILLGYMTHLKVKGLWMGMLCGSAAQTLIVLCITLRINWDRQVEKTKARLNRWTSQPQHDANHINS